MRFARWNNPEATWPSRLSELHHEIDRLFQLPFSRVLAGQCMQPFRSGWSPAVNVHEDGDNLYVTAELPGMKKEDIDLSLHEGVLTLAGERKPEQRYPDAEVYRSERFVGRFQRTISLPTPVDVENVKASYVDGVLRVTLPKTEAAKPRQIQVKAN